MSDSGGDVTYDQWERQVPDAIKSDPLWRVDAYRLGLFVSDLAWPDALRLLRHKLMASDAAQFHRAAANISSNICEGFSRSTGPDRARFFEYSLGSVREMRDWYYKARRVLSTSVIEHRIGLSTQLVKLLTTMINNERRRNKRISARDSATLMN